MPTFREDQIVSLVEKSLTVMDRRATLTERILSHTFRTETATEFATHGIARRVADIAYSIGRVFETLPPDLDDIPTSEQRSEATAHIQAVSFNTYGCMDNLARVWVSEYEVRRPNGRELAASEVGLAPKCAIVRASLPQNLQEQLQDMDRWFAHLEEVRHTTAHRIPLYIPPFMIDPENAAQYKDLNEQAYNALSENRLDDYHALIGARDGLRFFRPMIATSVNQGANALFHPQLLADFATVELWIGHILDNLPAADRRE
ncbi:hypothetical protein [Parerythrobacter lacustris]|uniref:Uncharacterized protein n=1 Tax=Parerythrobacter lacustris TaxID=2969984 RepID=A0ABT1XUR6_9SPHN|nr:hypothetical protein [Parerythrobacter lacustris]MCR2835004.1 hypothetical protein [Parerythrobacter lacustris]